MHRLLSINGAHENALLDIVFVHGLTGGPYTTWNGRREYPEPPRSPWGVFRRNGRREAAAASATPHGGSGLASLVSNLDAVIRTAGNVGRIAATLQGAPGWGRAIAASAAAGQWLTKSSNQVQWLEKAGPELRELASVYRGIATDNGISTRAYYETQPFVRGFAKRATWIVDASNADPGLYGCKPEGVGGANHSEICKPASPQSDLHVNIVTWLSDLARAADRGRGRAVLHEDIHAAVEPIVSEKPAWRQWLRPMPKRWEDIPARTLDGKRLPDDAPNGEETRRVISHELREEMRLRFDAEISARLASDARLVVDLARSGWDVDRFVLALWHARQISAVIGNVNGQLREELGIFERSSGAAPSLIPTFRLVDELREALSSGGRTLGASLKEMNTAITSAPSNLGQIVDGDGRTRKLLSDGSDAMTALAKWEKPPKK